MNDADHTANNEDVQFLKPLSRLRIKQSSSCPPLADIHYMLSDYCTFDVDRVRYAMIKQKKKIALIGVVCSIGEDRVVLSSLTRKSVSVGIEKISTTLGDVLLLLEPRVLFKDGKMRFEIRNDKKVMIIGKAIDFGICTFVDKVIETAVGIQLRTQESGALGQSVSDSSQQISWSYVHCSCKGASPGHIPNKAYLLQIEFKNRGLAIAKRPELAGALVYNEILFKYRSNDDNVSCHGRLDASDVAATSERKPAIDKKRKRPFYELPGFEQEVDDMPAGKEKSHYQALLRKVKPKRIKTFQQQVDEHLAKRRAEKEISDEAILRTPRKLIKDSSALTQEDAYVLLESVEPHPSDAEISCLIASLRKATQCISGRKNVKPCTSASKEHHPINESDLLGSVTEQVPSKETLVSKATDT